MEIKTVASGSKGNAYLISDGQTRLLLECGISFKDIQKALKFQTNTISGCLLSHEHKDHSKSVADLLKAGIDVYMSKGTAEAEGVLDHHRLNIVKSKKQLSIGTWNVLPFDVQHDAAEPLGFLLANKQKEKLLFATDTFYIKYRFKGISHLMIECNYSQKILESNIERGLVHPAMKKRLLASHFSLENLLEFLRANDLSKLQEIYLLHLSDRNSDEKLFKREIQKVTGVPVYVA